MQVAGMALEIIAHGRKAHDVAVGSDEELKVQSGAVGRAAAEAAVLGRVGEWFEMFLWGTLHRIRIIALRKQEAVNDRIRLEMAL
jgi:hypothetical protein